MPPDRLSGGDGGDFTAVTNETGTFSIAAVPTILGNLSIGASATVEGEELSGGLGGVTPVRGGTTDTGAIVVAALQFERNLGEFLGLCDDCSTERTLPFPFPFFGQTHSSLHVNNNGNVTFGTADGDFSESLFELASYPRIAAFWDDLINGGAFVNDQIPGRFIVTWSHIQEYCCFGDNTVQLTLFADGRIAVIYNGLTALDAVVGLSPGGGDATALQVVDFSAGQVTSTPGSSVAEQFGATPFDLDLHFLLATPKPAGGYDFVVRPFTPPPSGLALGGSSLPGVRLDIVPPVPPR